MFHWSGARKKKRLTDPVQIIPFPNQNLREKAQNATVKPAIKQEPVKNSLIKEPPRVMTAPSGKLTNTGLSIKRMLQKNEEVEDGGRLDLSNMPKNAFSIDDLKMAWRQFAFSMKEKGKETFYNALIKRDPKQISEDEFVLEVDNQVQIDYIQPHLSDLLGYIRAHVKNYHIEIKLELTTNPDQEVKYQTGKDKFAALARKNPNLHTLKNLFNLDIEF